MLEFTQSLIHDKPVKRMIQILEILDNGQNLVPSKDIAEQLQCSIRTVSSDISQLKSYLPEHWDIISVKSKGYILIKPITNSILPIINSYLDESIIYKIMLGLFNNKCYTLEKWSQNLFVSKLTLKKQIKEHKKMLTKSMLEIKLREIQLEGEELNIRHYYHAFFYNTQKYTRQFLLPNILREEILNILREHKVTVDFEMLCVILSICINRVSNKCYIKSGINDVPIYDSYQADCITEIILTFERYYSIKLPENEIKALNVYLILVFATTSKQSEVTLEYLKEFKNDDYHNYLKLIDILMEKHNIKEEKKEKLVVSSSSIFYYCLIYSQYNLSLGFYFSSLDKLENESLQDYKKDRSLVSFWNKTHNENRMYKEEIEVFTTYATLLLNSFADEINILFLFNGTEVEKRFIYSTLTNSIGGNVKIYNSINDRIKYDFIITNYQPPNTKTPIIYFSGRLTESDINSIKSCIYHLN
ncbi:helix-turn-helix domain containing protein [Bacillus cereus group sp. MG9]|uniref:helix-turn-helix domain-containing protein n=1 Tax=Bacillus cereus group sp. MG9 TaxID=3040247 RepID=UPI0033945208